MKKEDMKKDLPIFIVVLIIFSSITFFIGTKVSSSKNIRGNFSGENMLNFDRTSMSGYGILQNRKTGAFGNMINGEVLSKDESGITIKLRDGGSKIIFISDTTVISKSVVGVKDDIVIGNNISVNGKTNTDGSFSAITVDIREQSKIE